MLVKSNCTNGAIFIIVHHRINKRAAVYHHGQNDCSLLLFEAVLTMFSSKIGRINNSKPLFFSKISTSRSHHNMWAFSITAMAALIGFLTRSYNLQQRQLLRVCPSIIEASSSQRPSWVKTAPSRIK